MRRLPASLLMVALVGVSILPWLAHAPAASAKEISANAWIGVSSVRPSVGCAIDLSVELRDTGRAVEGAEIEVALHVDGSLLSADRGKTGENGVSFVSLQTSESIVGVQHWLDVNVSGVYFTGFPVVTTSSGSCNDSYRLIEAQGDISVFPAAAGAGTSSLISGSHTKVRVPTHQQQRSLSCEYAALQIATSAFGNGISEYNFDNVVGRSANPHIGYRGNINGSWGRTDDYGVYATPLAWALDANGFRGEPFYAVGSTSALTSRLDQGKPVLVWLALWGDESIQETLDGRTYTITAGMHVMVAYGYDSSGVYLSDPGVGTYRYYSWGDFMWMWNVLDGMGLAVSPY